MFEVTISAARPAWPWPKVRSTGGPVQGDPAALGDLGEGSYKTAEAVGRAKRGMCSSSMACSSRGSTLRQAPLTGSWMAAIGASFQALSMRASQKGRSITIPYFTFSQPICQLQSRLALPPCHRQREKVRVGRGKDGWGLMTPRRIAHTSPHHLNRPLRPAACSLMTGADWVFNRGPGHHPTAGRRGGQGSA